MTTENIEIHLNAFNQYGIFGLCETVVAELGSDALPRIKAYSLLKIGRQLIKRSKNANLAKLPSMALDLSYHESVYRQAALFYVELNDVRSALECIAYLHYYYAQNKQSPHEQYNLILKKLIESGTKEEDVKRIISSYKSIYDKKRSLVNVKECGKVLPVSDASEQKSYFKWLYRRFDLNTVLASIYGDDRFNQQQKAVLLLRAGRAVGAIAEEGHSVESVFAEKALALSQTESIVKNGYQAYLRAGNLEKIQELKNSHKDILA